MPAPKVLALVLAGGEGGRLGPLTERRAKPAVPFGGVYRLIDFALSNCQHSGLSDVWILEQYQPHTLNDHLANGRPWDLDRTYGGLQLLPPYIAGRSEAETQGGFAHGNADAIYRQIDRIRAFGPDVLLVLSADHVYQFDYWAAIDRHREANADLTMVTTRVQRDEASRFGLVEVDDQGKVTGYWYKPESPPSDLATTEVFIFDPGRLIEGLEELAAGRRDDSGEAGLRDLGHALLPEMVRRGRVVEHRFEGYWRDVGTIESYWLAHRDLLAAEPAIRLDDPAWPILSYGVQRRPAWIAGSARIDGSLISPGCQVRGEVVRSIIAPGATIGVGAVVRDTILLHDARVESGARVDAAILDERVRVGSGARVGQPLAGRDRESDGGGQLRIMVAGCGAVIPDGATVEAGALITPPG